MYFYILGALIVILIAGKIIYKTAKYFPTRMRIRYSPTAIRQYRFSKGRKMILELFPGKPVTVSCVARALTPYRVSGKNTAAIEISDIKVKSSDVNRLVINGKVFTRDEIGWMDSSGKPIKECEPFRIQNGSQLEVTLGNETVKGIIECPRRDY